MRPATRLAFSRRRRPGGTAPDRTVRRVRYVLLHAALWTAVFGTVLPIVFTFFTSLKLFRDIVSGRLLFAPTLSNYRTLFEQSEFLRLTANSLVVAAASTGVVLGLSSLGSYGLIRYRWPAYVRRGINSWLLFLYMVPAITLAGPFYLLSRALGLYDTPLAVIMAHSLLNLPFAMWMLQTFIADVPVELEEAGRIDGCSRFGVFWKVTLPVARAGVTATGILVFVFSWIEFLMALTLTSTPRGMTVPIGIAGFVQEFSIRYGEMAAAACFAALPAVFFVSVAQRYIVRGLTLGALKG